MCHFYTKKCKLSVNLTQNIQITQSHYVKLALKDIKKFA